MFLFLSMSVCTNPPQIANGNYSYVQGHLNVIQYTCNDGFQQSGSVTKFFCNKNGWEKPPVCTSKANRAVLNFAFAQIFLFVQSNVTYPTTSGPGPCLITEYVG